MIYQYVYKIVPKGNHLESDIYIGSTKQPLSVRFSKHKHDYKRYINGKYNYVSVFKLFEKYNINECEIKLIEQFDNIEKQLLRKYETYYIINMQCVNIKKPLKNLDGITSGSY